MAARLRCLHAQELIRGDPEGRGSGQEEEPRIPLTMHNARLYKRARDDKGSRGNVIA